MFSGIVERSVRVASVAEGTGFRRLNLAIEWADVQAGESVAINGVCLTVAEIIPPLLAFDVVPETLAKTNLGMLGAGDTVHVERALRLSDRISGHLVLGHVDGLARLTSLTSVSGDWRLIITPPTELMKFIVPRGSVCLDGVSLTVARVADDSFEVALIPTTIQTTHLGSRDVGWLFNLETDIISKTIVTYLERLDPRLPK